MNIFLKLVKADSGRKTRFHDQQGNLLPLSGAAELPRRLLETLLVKLGYHPSVPWWPTPARRRIESLIEPKWQILEFGSGMSTRWLSRRVAQVTAIENDPVWYHKVNSQLIRDGLNNSRVILRDLDSYLKFEVNAAYNLVIIDGQRRKDCLLWAMSNVALGGYIYLDNSDRNGGGDSEGVRAELIYQQNIGAIKVDFLRGIPPGLFATTEGALAQRLR